MTITHLAAVWCLPLILLAGASLALGMLGCRLSCLRHGHQHADGLDAELATLTTRYRSAGPGPHVTTASERAVLTQAQADHFLTHGYVRIQGCFTREQAEQLTATIWIRLGYDPRRPLHLDRTVGPHGHPEPYRRGRIIPKACGAACDLVGGEERIAGNYPVG